MEGIGKAAAAVQDGGARDRARPEPPPAPRWWLCHLTVQLVIAGGVLVLPSWGRLAALAVGAGLLLVAGVRLAGRRPRLSTGWYLLLGVVTPGLLLRPIGALSGLGPMLTPLWALHVVAVLGYGAALVVLPARRRGESPWAGMTEAGILACGAVILWWVLVVEPLDDPGSRLPSGVRFAVAPALDMVLLLLTARTALLAVRRSMPDLLVCFSAGAMLVGDVNYSVAGEGGSPLSLACWSLAAALLATAALHPRARGRVPSPAEDGAPVRSSEGVALRVWVYAPVLAPAVTAVSLVHAIADDGPNVWDVVVPLGATTATAALVVLRLFQVDRTARRRSADLDARTGALQDALRSEAQLQRELRHRALHDPLTGLPNRFLWQERTAEAVHRRATGAVLIADVDGFTDINDRFGHAAGDEVLLAVAERMRALLGPADLLARPGGDEFAVLMVDIGVRTAERRGDSLVAAMRRPVTVRGNELYATVSVGLRPLEPAGNAVDLLRDADLALHAAKAAGRDQLMVYSEALREERLARTRAVERLRAAVDDDELRVFYQPMVGLRDGRFQAVEALVRWQPPGRPLVLPDRFIPAAEDSGLIVRLGAWVLRRACRDAATWHQRYGTLLSVNVSPRQLRELDFVDVVRQALADAALPASALVLEITEGVLVDSGAQTELAIAHLSRLRLDGVRVAVDDFGTGYSSLAYLRDLPIDLVKIDRSFLPSEAVDAAQRTVLVRAIIDLAAGLGLGTVAEGVERPEQAALLRRLGCERAQGFLFARPAPADEVAALLADAVTAV